MFKRLIKRKIIFTISAFMLTAVAFFPLIVYGVSPEEVPEIYIISLIPAVITLCMLIDLIIYYLRLTSFIKKSGAVSLEAILRKSWHRIDEKYYWLKDYFLDMTRIKKIDYSSITRIKTYKLWFTPIIGSGFLRGTIREKELGVDFYGLKIYCGWKSITLNTGIDPKYCRYAANLFIQRNRRIKLYDNIGVL